MTIKDAIATLLVGAALPLAFLAGRATATPTTIDTLVIRDTLTRFLPQPIERKEISSEVVMLPRLVPLLMPADTVERVVAVEVPVERVVYEEEDYRAVVEGFNPRLVEMTLYPKTTVVHTTARASPIELRAGPAIAWGWTPHGFDLCVGAGAVLTFNF